jgi:RNA polymerase sigma-70 factor, ECF subfamily
MSRFRSFVALNEEMGLTSFAPVAPLADSALSDAELVARARGSDAWAEGAIYRRYARPLANLAARILGSREEALDVVHDVFVQVFDDLGHLRDPAALRPWLMQQTVRQVHRRLRRRRWWRWLGRESSEDLSLGMMAAPSCAPDVRLELAGLSARLGELPHRQRIAWVLHRIEGETLPAIARACETSLATVKRDIAAAQEALGDRDSLQEEP